jgi:probable HAF family extracellular repeat protein
MQLNFTRVAPYRVALPIARAHAKLFLGVFALAALIGASLALPAQAQNFYRVTDLGDLPGGLDESIAFGINDSGEVAGRSSAATGPRAFRWTSGGGMQDLQDLPGGNDYSEAFAINSSGQVVGRSLVATGYHAFVWTSGGGMQDLGDLPGGDDYSSANGINSNGQIVGQSRDASGWRAFLWTSGGMQDLGDLLAGFDESHAFDINDSGQVAGWGRAGSDARAFIWSAAGGMTLLGDLPGGEIFSHALAISDGGQVVGRSVAKAGSHAFLWTAAGGMQDLGDLPGGSDDSVAYGNNDNGQVVGDSWGATGPRAFLWTSGTGMQDLNNMLDASGVGWRLGSASAINNAGQIVGLGINALGKQHAFLLTPTAEPPLLAFTEFEDPPLGSANFTPDPASVELGFATTTSATGGQNPLAGVANDPARGRVFSHRSINAATTLEAVDLTGYDDVFVSLSLQVANTTYEAGDFVRAYVTDGTQTIDLVNFSATAGMDAIDSLAGDGFLRYRATIPNDWTQARLVISSSTNSTQAPERFDFDSIEFRGVAVIPEPSALAISMAIVVVALLCAKCRRTWQFSFLAIGGV